MSVSKLETRLARLEQAAAPKRVIFIPVLHDGVDPLPEYLSKHPEARNHTLYVVDTGIRRGETSHASA
jgi:hypothetical protein